MSVNINEFFSAISNDPNLAIHFPFLWGVRITEVSEGEIQQLLQDVGESWGNNVRPLTDYTNVYGTGNILVAQEVTLPSETSEFSSISIADNRGGFLPGYAMNSRTDFLNRQLVINFLETETDIVHNMIRPWMIAIGIDGLTNKLFKGHIEVKQYTNDGKKVLKGYKFVDAFPTAIEGYTLSYGDDDFKIKSVTFACRNYEKIA